MRFTVMVAAPAPSRTVEELELKSSVPGPSLSMIVSAAVVVLICEPAGVALASLNTIVLFGAFAVPLSVIVTGKVLLV